MDAYAGDKRVALEALGNMSTGAATSAGITAYVFSFISENVAVFSLMVSIISVIAAIIFYTLNYRMRRKEHDLNVRKFQNKLDSQEKQ